MSSYVEFDTKAGGPILVEVSEAEVVAQPGVEKAGLLVRPAGDAVARARSSFEEAVNSAVGRSVSALADAVGTLPIATTDVELTSRSGHRGDRQPRDRQSGRRGELHGPSDVEA